jgi:hypothetical protein
MGISLFGRWKFEREFWAEAQNLVLIPQLLDLLPMYYSVSAVV